VQATFVALLVDTETKLRLHHEQAVLRNAHPCIALAPCEQICLRLPTLQERFMRAETAGDVAPATCAEWVLIIGLR